jgi:hypothetical protein
VPTHLKAMKARHSARGPFDPVRRIAADDLQCVLEAAHVRRRGYWLPDSPPEWVSAEVAGGEFPLVVPSPLSESLQGSPALLLVLYDPSLRAPASEGDVRRNLEDFVHHNGYGKS